MHPSVYHFDVSSSVHKQFHFNRIVLLSGIYICSCSSSCNRWQKLIDKHAIYMNIVRLEVGSVINILDRYEISLHLHSYPVPQNETLDLHSSMAERSIWFGVSIFVCSLTFVTGDTSCLSSHVLIAMCSYVKPSAAICGSSIIS